MGPLAEALALADVIEIASSITKIGFCTKEHTPAVLAGLLMKRLADVRKAAERIASLHKEQMAALGVPMRGVALMSEPNTPYGDSRVIPLRSKRQQRTSTAADPQRFKGYCTAEPLEACRLRPHARSAVA